MGQFNLINKLNFLPTKEDGRFKVRSAQYNELVNKLNSFFPAANTLSADTISESTSGSGVTVDGVKFKDGAVISTNTIGTVGTGVTAIHYGDGKNFTTVLDIVDLEYAVAAAADEAIGKLIYTFPAGAHLLSATSMNITLQGGGTVDADTPDVGIGTVIATGAVAVLGGTATFEDIIDGQTATDCDGTAIAAFLKPDDELSVAADVKAVHLNIADDWAGADTVNVNGTVVLKWTIM
jgi:hypothetical protein